MTLLQEAIPFIKAYWPHVGLAIIICRLLANRYSRPLSHIPGPFLASLSNLWLFVHYVRRRGLTEFDLHQKYKSPLLRLGPNTISVADARAVRIIYGWKPVFSKSRLYISQDVTAPDGTVLQNISSTRSEELHRDLRRPVANAYSLSVMKGYEPLVDSTSLAFLKQMERFAATGEKCPFDLWLQMYAFDVIGEITFSKRFGFLESGRDLDHMMKNTAWALDYVGFMGQLPTLDEYLRIRGFGHIFRWFRKTNSIMKFTARQIAAHKTDRERPLPDFLTRFIEAREKYPEIITDRRLSTFANTNVSAGSDTTAIALREIVYRLLTHPGAKERFMDEIAVALRARNDIDVENPITWAEGQNMEYYQAVLKECLRLHSPLGQIIPRVVPEGGITLCGKYIPAGTDVGCNAWTVHRDREVYGEDADTFRPERWIDDDIDLRREWENLSFAFGGGPRVCLGKNIALLEISKLVPELFRRYAVDIVDAKAYKYTPGWLVPQQGLDVTLKEKDSSWWLNHAVA